MKKFFVMIAVSLLGVSAMAQEATVDQNDEATVEQNYDQQQMTEQDMQTFASPGEIIGGVIGGIIGGVIGGHDGRGDGRGGDGRDDGRGGWGPGRGGPGHGPGPGRPRAWVCYATNLRRQTFQAQDWDQRRAADMAMRSCQQSSLRCQPAGCRQY